MGMDDFIAERAAETEAARRAPTKSRAELLAETKDWKVVLNEGGVTVTKSFNGQSFIAKGTTVEEPGPADNFSCTRYRAGNSGTPGSVSFIFVSAPELNK